MGDSFKEGSGNLDFGSDKTDDNKDQSQQAATGGDSVQETEDKENSTAKDDYPYFVRRNNVLDGRDNRLEFHVRNKVADEETSFRQQVAQHLDTEDVAKTDVREFALLCAFEHPEEVAALMEDEGYGTFD